MKHEDLRRLNELKNKGIITEEEYERRKEKLAQVKKAHVYHVEQNHKEEYDKAHNNTNHHYHPNHIPLKYHYSMLQRKNAKTKSKYLAGFLGIVFGWLGLHNFYLNHHGKAILQLFMTFLSLIFMAFGGTFFIYIPIVWGFVEGVLILIGLISSDAHGVGVK